jgi:hypothetical protein
MSSLQEIESAITGLSAEDRERLVQHLPALLPEWEGEVAWQRIIHDREPSVALSRLTDAVDAEFRRNPEVFPEITEADFDRNS